MVRGLARSAGAALVLALTLVVGAVEPAQAATAKHLDVVVVEQVTSVVFFPPTDNYEGSAVDSGGHVWTFTESVTYDHWFGYGPFSMRSGADELSGNVNSVSRPFPLIGLLSISSWSYTVTGGQGQYAGCTGTGTPVRESVVVPLAPPPNGTVVESISFDLTCP